MKDFSSAVHRIETNHLIINKDYQKLLQQIQFDSFESIWRNRSGETVKNIEARTVIRFEVKHHNQKKTIYLKRHRLEFVGFSRLFSHFFPKWGLSQGRLEFENIGDFRNSNLPTVIPVAAGEKFFRFFWAESFLITEDFFPYISLEALLEDRPHFFTGPEGEPKKKILINEIAALARKMHQNGFNHRDFNATHILLHYDNGSDVPKIALFDLQRVERSRFFRFRWKIKSLARLNYSLPDDIFNAEDKLYIFLSYKGKTDLSPTDSLIWFWIKRKTAKIKRHTDKMSALKNERKKEHPGTKKLFMDNVDCKNSILSAPNSETRCPLCNSFGKFSFLGRDLLYNKTETYRYLQCDCCKAVYQDPMPTTEQISSFYPEDYKPHEQLGVPRQASQLKLAVLHHKYGYTHIKVPPILRLIAPIFSVFKYRDSIHFVPNGKAMDIGCGNGKFMRTMNFLGWRFEGVELNPIAVKACRSIGLKVFHGDLHAAALANNSFDLITARQVIEHIPDPANFMREISRVLKKGGRLVIETPNSKALGRQWFGANWFANDVPRHLVLYCSTNLHMLAKLHGLRLVEVKMFTSPKIILNSWDYLTGNRDRPSKKRKIRRLLAQLYFILATLYGRGDIVFAVYEK